MKKNSLFRAISCLLAVTILFACSFAYFTDYATEQATGTAGTVALSMDSNINLLDANGQDIINPGDMRDGSFTVTNEGNKSIDVRTTIALTTQSNTGFDLNFSGSASEQSEYDLYLRDDVEFIDGKGWQPKAGAQPLQVKNIDKDVITYVLPEYALNGNSDRYDEFETVDGVTEFAHTYDFVMVMKGGATNEWQNSSVSIDVLVEAKQHENTNAGWEIVAQENVTSGSIDQSAVKGESVISGIDGQVGNTGRVTFSLNDADTGAGIAGIAMKLINNADGSVVGTAISDANGDGAFSGLAAGDYKLTSTILALTSDADSLTLSTNHSAAHYEHSESISAWAGGIEGNLKNEEGEAIVGAKVEIKNENGEVVAGTKTDSNGDFSVYPIPEGEYTVEADGYCLPDSSANDKVTVEAGNTGSINMTVVVAKNVLIDGPYFNTRIKEIEAQEGVQLTDVKFVDTPARTDVNSYVVSHAGLSMGIGEIKAWVEGTTMYVASTDGGPMYLQADSSNMFKGMTALESVDFGAVVASDVTRLTSMFEGCTALKSVEFGDIFNSDQITDMSSMFKGCVALEAIDMSEFETGNVTSMANMFFECEGLTEVTGMSNWDVAKLGTTSAMFYKCSQLTELDLSGWETYKLNQVNSMFMDCTNLTTIYGQDWSAYVTTNVAYSGAMFSGCSNLVGAVAYNNSLTSYDMANPTTGYFTSK